MFLLTSNIIVLTVAALTSLKCVGASCCLLSFFLTASSKNNSNTGANKGSVTYKFRQGGTWCFYFLCAL